MPIPLGILAVAGAGAGAAGSFDLLETTVLTTTTASVTFSNLNTYSAYKHLQIRYTARTDRADNVDFMRVFLNSDTGSNYAVHNLFGDGSTVQSTASTSTNSPTVGRVTAASFVANGFGAGVIDILDFSSSSKNTTMRNLMGYAGAENRAQLISALWNNTAAVTTIQLDPSIGDFVADSRFSLYGVK